MEEPPRPKRLNEIRDRLALDTYFRREHVIANLPCEDRHVESTQGHCIHYPQSTAAVDRLSSKVTGLTPIPCKCNILGNAERNSRTSTCHVNTTHVHPCILILVTRISHATPRFVSLQINSHHHGWRRPWGHTAAPAPRGCICPSRGPPNDMISNTRYLLGSPIPILWWRHPALVKNQRLKRLRGPWREPRLCHCT